MPPSRRRTGNSAVKQATLSFGQKSKVSKASATSASSTKKEKGIERAASSVSAEDSFDEQVTTVALPSEPHTAEVAIRTQANAEVEQPRTKEDVRACKITEADLKRYWGNEERKKKARVRRDGLDTYENILRHFDLSSQYGPCVGISRLSRWRRAQMLSLDPPIEVLAVLLKEDDAVKPRAYIDELLSY